MVWFGGIMDLSIVINILNLLQQFSRFGFIPKTFVLPGDVKALKAAFDKEGVKKKWIVKPPASARGTGIQVSDGKGMKL